MVERIDRYVWHHIRFSSGLLQRQNAIHLPKGHRYYKQTKHIDVRYHRIHHWVVVEKFINLVKISTKKNPADIMTKIILVESSEHL